MGAESFLDIFVVMFYITTREYVYLIFIKNGPNMDTQQTTYLTSLRNIFWPIEWHENKKFLPMAAMMFFALFNYSMLRSIKDGFVVTDIGPEALGFLKIYVVLPSAIVAMVIYSKLLNVISQQKVFYTITGFFAVYFAVFTFILYPNPEFAHPDAETISRLCEVYPNFKWFIRIIGKWYLATFYIFAELWGSMMVSLLFWQFANQITKTDEAKRFYSMFGVLGNLGLLCTGFVLGNMLGMEGGFTLVLVVAIINTLCIMGIYHWINKNVLTDPNLYSPSPKAAKKAKVKLSLMDGFKLVLSSKYLGMIAILVLSYGISINLIEVVWKAKVTKLYPTRETYTMYMGQFQAWQGLGAIFFMIIGSNILRKVSWSTAAMLTPVMILITGAAFFAFIIFDEAIINYLPIFAAIQPLSLAVTIGMIQNVLSKATKYSLFDATKEMAYIPLDDELKSKGKAAVDVVGGRFGKSGGGLIQSSVFMLMPNCAFDDVIPFFASICMMIIIFWIMGVKSLGKEYAHQLKEHSY